MLRLNNNLTTFAKCRVCVFVLKLQSAVLNDDIILKYLPLTFTSTNQKLYGNYEWHFAESTLKNATQTD